MLFQRPVTFVALVTFFTNVAKRIQMKVEPVIPECVLVRESFIALGTLERTFSGVSPNVGRKPIQISAHLMANL